MSLDLSIVIATLNRKNMLLSCIESIVQFTPGLSWELIVVDGGSTDGTVDTIGKDFAGTLSIIEQGKRLGAIKAYNAGFAIARGEFTVALNDDLLVQDHCLVNAVDLLREKSIFGQIAIPFITPHIQKPKLDFVTAAGQRWLYANFGVTHTDLGKRLGWWGNHYYHYAGDVELSMKIWNAGLQVWPLYDRCLYHIEANDSTRVDNNDSALFYQQWKTWKGVGDANPRFAGSG